MYRREIPERVAEEAMKKMVESYRKRKGIGREISDVDVYERIERDVLNGFDLRTLAENLVEV